MTVSASEWELVVVVLFFVLIAALVGYYLIHRLRAKRDRLAMELGMSPDLVRDRSFNRVRLARSELAVLKSRGLDVSRPEAQLDEAEKAQARNDHDHAIELANSAHDFLVRLQRDPTSATPPPSTTARRTAPSAAPDLAASVPLLDASPMAGPRLSATPAMDDAPPPRPAIPKNKAEARFELGVLGEEIARLSPEHAADPGVVEATGMRTNAQAAFDRNDFTEALRLALRARRRLGARLESLPPPVAPAAVEEPHDEETLLCTSCGQPLRGNDRFCRYCGTLRSAGRCPSCGTPMTESDRFCGGCGRPGAPAPAPG